MKKLRILKDMPGFNKGDIVEIWDETRVIIKDPLCFYMYSAIQLIDSGYAEWVEDEPSHFCVPGVEVLTSCPPQYKCKFCGKIWYAGAEISVCESGAEPEYESKISIVEAAHDEIVTSEGEHDMREIHDGYILMDGRVYESREEAEAEKARIDAYRKIKQFADSRNGDWVSDPNSETQRKYFVERIFENALCVNCTYDYSSIMAVPYFRDEDDAVESSHKFEREYKILAGIKNGI